VRFLSCSGCSCTFRTEVALGREVKAGVLIAGIGVGSGYIYLMDPDRGRCRRALLHDKTASVYRRVLMSVARAPSDLVNRAHGLITNATSVVQEQAGDDQLMVGVRAKIGLVSHPHAVEVIARDGRNTVSGEVLEQGAAQLL